VKKLVLTIRRANLDDLKVLVQMRLEFFREVGSLKNGANTTALAEATRQYLIKKMPRGEFMAWIAEVEGWTVGISGLALWERPPLYEAYAQQIQQRDWVETLRIQPAY
jgi:hypothetical protein